MLGNGRITAEHVKKLDHPIEEIRLRALDNLISKYDLGFVCDCGAVRNRIILKLFNWFSLESVAQPKKVLNFLLRLVQAEANDYSNTIERLRFQNELCELKKKIPVKWHTKLNKIEEAILGTGSEINKSNVDSTKDFVTNMTLESDKCITQMQDHNEIRNEPDEKESQRESTSQHKTMSSTTLQDGIRWLTMPWQPLVTSDKAVLAAVEEALNNTTDTDLILHTCQFIMNVMMQDFPAEVFLQRPAIVMILHGLLRSNAEASDPNVACVIPIVLKTLRKLTRALRFRIYYYCEPCIANKEQKLLASKLDNNAYAPSETGDGPDGGVPEVNYVAYQSAGTSERSQSINENIDESALQSQILLPVYCIESLKYVLFQLSVSVDSTLPLRNIKHIMDLAHELVRLLVMSITPYIWFHKYETKIQDDLKTLFELLGEMMRDFYDWNNVDYLRITYLHLIAITIRLLDDLVPLNMAQITVPDTLQEFIVQIEADASINLLYPELHIVISSYARQFSNYNDELLTKLIHQETPHIIKCMKNAISISEDSLEVSLEETLKILTTISKMASYYEISTIVKIALKYLRDNWKHFTNSRIDSVATDLAVTLLNHEDKNVYHIAYIECHVLVKSILGVKYNEDKLSWENLLFLLKPEVLTLIICDGATSKDTEINEVSKDILIFILKGKVQMGETGWLKTIEAIVPVLHLLQCHADTCTPLGQCINKLFDPDIANSISLPLIEILKGNIRFLYSQDSGIREEASSRLIWFLAKEEKSNHKLPRLSSVIHNLCLSSICVLERRGIIKNMNNIDQFYNIATMLKMLRETSVDPQIRKSVLNQLNVIFANVFWHEIFFEANGLPLILDIFDKALTEEDYMNYPDSVIPIISILKSLSFFDYSTRKNLSTDSNVLLNIIRSLFLFPNDESMRSNGSQLLCLLAYGEHAQKYYPRDINNSGVSLPYIVLTSMKVPFECPYLSKPMIHVQMEQPRIFDDNYPDSRYFKLHLAWELHGDRKILWKRADDLNIPVIINQKNAISEKDLLFLQYNSIQYCCQEQLYNIQNSTTHSSVLCALDYLTMYLKFYEVLPHIVEDIDSLPWEQTLKRFLLSRPTNKEDYDLFVDILNFLHLYLTVRKNDGCSWISKIVKNMTGSLADLFKNLEVDNQSVHQFIFKLVRTCSAIEAKSNDKSKNTWIQFIEFVVSTLCFGDQQRFYNLAYLDWLLTCLTYLIGQCEWGHHKNLLISLSNTLIELIMSFHGAGTVSFMGLSITRNSIICLNHLLHQMQVNFNKNSWTVFWYEEGRSLSWLPMLWQNRDPLVRASAIQLLAGLMNIVHTMSQLLNAIVMAPSDLCHTLLQYITNKEECCLVKEEACIAFSNMLKNCSIMSFHCDDSLQPQVILIYAEQYNIYHEISVLCSNIYNLTTVDIRESEYQENSKNAKENGKTLEDVHKTVHYVRDDQAFILPHIIWRLYYCQNECNPEQPLSTEKYSSDLTFMPNYITTPALITAICTLLNNLIFIGQHEVVRQIYEHSIDKYLFWCLDKIPEIKKSRKDLNDYWMTIDKLEMYINICTVLTNAVRHSKEYTNIVLFSRDSLYILFRFLDIGLCHSAEPRLIYLRNRLCTEIYNFIAALSLMENKHFETIRSALELCQGTVLTSIYFAIKNSETDLRMSAISCLVFLLSLEIQKTFQEKEDTFLGTMLDNIVILKPEYTDNSSEKDGLGASKFKRNIKTDSSISNKSEEDVFTTDKEILKQKQKIGGELCEVLLHLFTAYNYAKSKKNSKQAEDKDLVTDALTNLLCISEEAKKTALQNNFPETALMALKELYVKLNSQPYELYKKQMEKKSHSLLHDVNCIFMLLMNFMYGNARVKESLTKEGLADVMHKLWTWISLNKTVLISALKLLATFTTKCNIAAQSLTLTTIIPGSGLRKTPNTLALIHVIIQVINKETERIDQLFDNHRIHYAFHILRNAVHVHECRVSISKSNLLQFFTKIHPSATKKTKSWSLMQMYCLEFLIDFTYYEEGQLCVPKTTDALDVLIYLAKDSSSSIKVLAISILRNLAFHITNRSRFLSSVDFINLMHDIFKNGSPCEVNLAGSILWSLISNNQKGKLVIRSAGFPQSIRQAVGRFTLQSDVKNTEPNVVKILLYVLSILNPDVKNNDSESNDRKIDV